MRVAFVSSTAMRTGVVTLAVVLAACTPEADAPSAAATPGQWVDLTHTLGEDAVFWPTAEGYSHEEVAHGETPGGWFYSSYNIRLSEHGGTHLDAPIHFAEGRQTADEIPLDSLIGPAAVIDVSEAALADRDYRLTAADIAAWERRHEAIAPGTIVLVRTGYDRFWPDREKYMGTAERGEAAIADLHFPGIGEDAAKLLVERGIAAVGLDTPSLDYGQSQDFIAHRILLGKNVPGFENVARLDLLPPTGATVVALPTKIAGGSGGPLRIVAQLPAR